MALPLLAPDLANLLMGKFEFSYVYKSDPVTENIQLWMRYIPNLDRNME